MALPIMGGRIEQPGDPGTETTEDGARDVAPALDGARRRGSV